jgi:hypothetical protein
MCSIPCGWTIACVLGWVLTRMIIAGEIYFKPIPTDGFASDADKRRFYVDDILDQRRRKAFKATLTWPAIWAGGAMIGFLVISFISNFEIVRAEREPTAIIESVTIDLTPTISLEP